MGNSELAEKSQLQFIQILEDKNFGEVDIFRNEEGQYIMKLRRTHISGDKRCLDFRKMLQFAGQSGNKGVVPVIKAEVAIQKSICIEYEIASVFTQYFNYTLQDCVAGHKQFEEGELWFTLHKLLGLISYLRAGGFAINLTLGNIFINLKGTPCIYAFHLMPYEDYIMFYGFGMGQVIGRCVLQLVSQVKIDDSADTQENQQQIVSLLGKVCQKYRLLGKLLKQLINREKNDVQAYEQIEQLLDNDKIVMNSEIKLNKFKYMLPDAPQIQQIRSPLAEKSRTQTQTINFKPSKHQSGNKANKIVQPLKTQESGGQKVRKNKVNKQTNKPSEKLRTDYDAGRGSILNELRKLEGSELLQSARIPKFLKGDTAKLLLDIQRKKQLNRAQQAKFAAKKQNLLRQCQNKENATENSISESHFRAKKQWTRKNINEFLRFSNRH